MTDQLKNRADLRRQKILRNSQHRLKVLLGESKLDDKVDITSNEQFEDCAQMLVTNDVASSLEPTFVLKKKDCVDYLKSSVKMFEDEQKKNDKVLQEFIDKSKLDIKPEKNTNPLLWLSICIFLAVGFSLYTIRFPNDNIPFIAGFIMLITINLGYVALGGHQSVQIDPILNAVLIMFLKVINASKVTQKFLFNILNMLILTGNYFCVYCFFFFGTFKLCY